MPLASRVGRPVLRSTVVYEGYTPGYLGTVVTPDGTVVYGTGYAYQPWIGDTWYAAPATYSAKGYTSAPRSGRVLATEA